MRRISVVGSTGSGKTTFASTLAARLDVPHVEIDALHWGPNWTPRPGDERDAALSHALQSDGWVTDGNYRSIQDQVWEQADTVVWLDYSFPRTFWQLLRRTLRRVISQKPLWSDNRESLRAAFLSRDSIFAWLFQSYWRHRREYPARQLEPRWGHLQFVRLRSPRETAAWLDQIAQAQPSRNAH